MYLLDTDTVIYTLKGNAAVEENLRLHYSSPMYLSVITLMELYYGAYKSQKVTSNLAKIKILENSMAILSLDREVTEIFGMQKSDLEKNGVPLDDFDLAIASTALAYNLILVTNNVRHFKRIDGLKIENWTEAPAAP